MRQAMRNSKNVQYSLMQQNERLCVYHSTNGLIPNEIEKNIKKTCNNEIVTEFLKTAKVHGGIFYECSMLVIHGTQYHKGQFVILPGSTNSHPIFGRIVKLLCDSKFGYFMYEETSNVYCPDMDFFMIKIEKVKDVVKAKHISSHLPLEAYEVGEKKIVSLSLRHNILEHV